MKKALISIIVCLTITINGCKDDSLQLSGPTFALQYTVGTDHYSAFSDYAVNFMDPELVAERSLGWPNDSLSDSVMISYSSLLSDRDGRPVAVVIISKNFKKTQLDPTGYFPKDDADFYDIFKTGTLTVKQPLTEGLDFILNTVDSSYGFGPALFNPPVPAHLDTFNHFEITEVINNVSVTDSFSWSSLYLANPYLSTEARIALVKFNFKCKLFNYEAPHDSVLVTDGIFQGFFADR